MNKQTFGKIKPCSRTESLVVASMLTGIMIPARILFIKYVSDDWFGSLGVLSAIIVATLILAKKQKLGPFSGMFMRQVQKIHKGKQKWFFYSQVAVFLTFSIIVITAINLGNSEDYSHYKIIVLEILVQTDMSFFDFEPLLEKYRIEYEQKQTIFEEPEGIILEFFAFILAMTIIDEYFDGWVMHFWTVMLVEEIEIMGILTFTRFSFR